MFVCNPATRRAIPALMLIGILLSACAVAGTPSGSAPATADSAASQQAPAAICEGRNNQDLTVDEPARTYGLAWNETDAVARRALIDQIWADDGAYVDPTLDERITGREALNARISEFQVGRDGQYFEWRDWESGNLHHDRVRMPWRLCDADGPALLEGTDFGLIDADGRLSDVTGFHPPE